MDRHCIDSELRNTRTHDKNYDIQAILDSNAYRFYAQAQSDITDLHQIFDRGIIIRVSAGELLSIDR